MMAKKITAGENLKRIRKDLNLKQYEIAGNDITRNLISLIENNKTPIYYNVANIISKNINRILYERGLDTYIQAEDILNPERYEARNIANNYIKMLEKHLQEENYNLKVDELNEIENFLNKWNFVDKKVKIYQLLGEIYYKAKDYNREYYYYIKALEISYEHPNMKDRYKLILRLVHNCILTKKYHEAIRLCEFALSTQENLADRQKGIFHYNLALSYYHLKDYFAAIDQIIYAKYYIPYDSYEDMKNILLLEGVCNSQIRNFDGSLRIYDKLLKIIDENNPETLMLIYNNIRQIYIQKSNKSKVIEYHNKILNLLPYLNKNSFYLVEILINIAETYYYLEDYELYEQYLKKALSLAKESKNKNLISKALTLLVDYYIEKDQFDKIKNLLQDFESEICNFKLDEKVFTFLKIIYYFINNYHNEEAHSMIKKIIEKRGNGHEA
jgi:tetratricopeptide (TPR) repeat protein